MVRWNKLALALGALGVAAGIVVACSKSAGNQDMVSSQPTGASAPETIAVPHGSGGPSMLPGQKAEAPLPPVSAADDDRFKLKPEEGQLAIEPPGDAKAGAEAVARITVTPGTGYHVNTEYPIKLTLTPPAGVTLAKAEFVAGGHDKGKGDADALDEKQLAFAVKLTPAATGSYTINGSFKFAVCDRDQCLAKKAAIAIAVAAK